VLFVDLQKTNTFVLYSNLSVECKKTWHLHNGISIVIFLFDGTK